MKEPNPEYPKNLGATVAKFRRAANANGGMRDWEKRMKHAYGDAVAKAIRIKQRSEFFASLPTPNLPKCNCASGTAHNTGEAIHEAIRAQQTAALRNHPAQVRRKRTDYEWQSLYDEAMRDKAKYEPEAV